MSETRTKIGDDSWVSMALFRTVLGGVIMAAFSLIGAVFWAASVNAKLEAAVTSSAAAVVVQAEQGKDIAAIRESMAAMQAVIVDVQDDLADQWKLSDTIWWTAEFQRLNPTIAMPSLSSLPSLVRDGNERK